MSQVLETSPLVTTEPEGVLAPGAGHAATHRGDLAEMDKYAPRFVPVQRQHARIGCVIPAYNEEGSIGQVLGSLLEQTHVPDEIHVVVNNSSDETFWVAREFAGRHERWYRDELMVSEVYVHDAGSVPDRKVGALNIGFAYVEDCDYLLGVDGDAILRRDTVERLLAEIESDRRIGGISAIYTMDYAEGRTAGAKYLISGQRQQFASFNMQNLLRGRNMAVIGGQCSIFSVEALQGVRDAYRQAGPWVADSEVEDSLLSLQLKKLGFATKISATARASVGAMTTLKALDAQQVKWSYGAIDLMWPGQRGNTSGQPFHPNLRLRWMENGSMLLNLVARVGFVLLLVASLSIGAWVFSPWWLVPPVVSVLLNLRVAMSMHDRSWRDILFAALYVPGEVYMWIKLGHFIRAWTKFFSRTEVDNWGAQAAAEQGRGGYAYLQPVLYLLAFTATLVVGWMAAPLLVKESVLWVTWPLLAGVTVMQTLGMAIRLVRRQRGFTV